MAATNPLSKPAFKETVSAVARDDRLVSGIVRVQSMYRGWKTRQDILNRHMDQIGASVHKLYGLDPWSPTNQQQQQAGFGASYSQSSTAVPQRGTAAPLSPLSRPMYPSDPLRSSGARHPGYTSPVAPQPRSGPPPPNWNDPNASPAASYPRGPASKYSKAGPSATWRLRRKLRMGDLMRGKPAGVGERQASPESTAQHGSREGSRKSSARAQQPGDGAGGREILSESDLRLFEQLTSPPKPAEAAAAAPTGGLSGRGDRKRSSVLSNKPTGGGTGSRKPSQVGAGAQQPPAQEDAIPEEPLAEQQQPEEGEGEGEGEDMEEIPDEVEEGTTRQRLSNFRSQLGANGLPKRWRDTKMQLLRDDMEWLRSKRDHLAVEKQNRSTKKQENVSELETLRTELAGVQEMKLQLLMEEEMKQRIEERQELEAEKQFRLEGLMQEREVLESWKGELLDMLKQIAEEGTSDPENETHWYQLQLEVGQQLEEVELQLVKNAEDLSNVESYFAAQTGNLPDEEEWMQKQWEDILKQKEQFLSSAQEQRAKQMLEAERRALEERAIKRTLFENWKQWRLQTRAKSRAMAAPINSASGGFESVSFPPRPSDLRLPPQASPLAGPPQPQPNASAAPAQQAMPTSSNFVAAFQQQPMTQMQMQQLMSHMQGGSGIPQRPPQLEQLRQLGPNQPTVVTPAAMTLPQGIGATTTAAFSGAGSSTAKPKFEIAPANTDVMFKSATAATRANFAVARPPERPVSQTNPMIPSGSGNARLPEYATAPGGRLLHKKPFEFAAFTASGAMPPATTTNYVIRHPAPVYAALATPATTQLLAGRGGAGAGAGVMSPTTAVTKNPYTPAAATGVAQLNPQADMET